MHEKKAIFCRTESVAMTPKSRDHMPTTSLWGVAAKWPTRAPKTKLIPCPRDPQGYSRISLSLSGRILRVPEHRVSFEANLMQYSMLATQLGVMRRSKKVSSFELYKFNPLSPHSGSTARELVHCYTWGRLRIVTVRGNTVGRIVNFFFVDHTHTQFTEESKMATALTP